GRGQVGGQLVVTNRRLLFGPIDTAMSQAIVFGGADAIGVPGAGLVKGVLEAYEPLKRKQVFLRHVTSVEARGNGGLFSAPGLRITTATGETIDYGIVRSTTTPNIHPGNRAVRDQAVAVINAAAQAARGR
ncbi:MAG: hypothetical protein H0U86_12410, partial [Chloroflexi bacterium]|nr:hypothetical protein [Chloroflexota bacterium]